jgi:hypothetical protein
MALAEGPQALPIKLTEPQAQQALAPLLQKMSETTDPYTLSYFLAQNSCFWRKAGV